MNSLHQADVYYDNPSSRSPRAPSFPTQSLNHPPSSRQPAGFDQQNGLFYMDDGSRFDGSRFNDRLNSTLPASYGYENSMPQQAWNSSGFGHGSINNNLAAIGATTRRPSGRERRAPLPQPWLDTTAQHPGPGGYPPMANPALGMPPMRQDTGGGDDEDLIPTAIVIKNIPFAVKKEQLVQVMTDMCLPLPYAFNYHFDNGVFRGLAFANFTTPEETQAVIQHMNHMELQGRKLRVEYKKMLPQAERDRIEREKRERRGQLEEQHRPLVGSQLQPSTSLSSISNLHAASPSPSSSRNPPTNLDYNDPVTLQFYSKLLLFQSDHAQGDVLDFSPSLPPAQRRILHGLAHNLNLAHVSDGAGDQRHIRIFRNVPANAGMNPAVPSMQYPVDQRRGALYRSATTDFSDVRDPSFYGPSRQSSGYLGYSESPGGLSTGTNLRAAKSHADLRSWTPSPVPSTSSFPAGLTGNVARYNEYGQTQNSPGSTRSGAAPTTTAMQPEPLLTNGIGNLTLSGGLGGTSGSPNRLRGIASWERDGPVPGPIGGHRAFSANLDDSNRSRVTATAPSRQPRGPTLNQGSGFPRGRQNGHVSRASDELSSPHNDVDNLVD